MRHVCILPDGHRVAFMIRRCAVVGVTVALLGACGGGGSGGERQVLVDYSPDDVAAFVAKNFPDKVVVTPGQTIVFKQNWTGEPHTVTGGSGPSSVMAKSTTWFALFNGYDALRERNKSMLDPENSGDATFVDFASQLKAAKPARDRDKVLNAWRKLMKTNPELPDIDNPPAKPFSEVNSLIDDLVDGLFDGLSFASGDNGDISQNVGQRCFLRTGAPPEQSDTPCSAAQQRQPDFDGTYSFYNSGILPYEGPSGNTYRMKIADRTKPGTYYFYCAVHGPGQSTEVKVVEPGTKVPSAAAVARDGRKAAERMLAPLQKSFRKAVRTNAVTVDGKKLTGPFAGLSSPIEASVNEFIPRTLRAKAGEPITWKVMGSDHTISFDVPPYLPIIQFGKTKVRLNPKVRETAGGAPPVQPSSRENEQPTEIDGGTYDGTGFWSSGLLGGDPVREYTLRITKRGTYPYACLVHPKMIGKVVVS
jgi:plastocyanin